MGCVASRDFKADVKDMILAMSAPAVALPGFNREMDRLLEMSMIFSARFLVYGWDTERHIILVGRRHDVQDVPEWRYLLSNSGAPYYVRFPRREMAVAEQIVADQITALYERLERDTRPPPAPEDVKENNSDDADKGKDDAIVVVFDAPDGSKSKPSRLEKYRIVIDTVSYMSALMFVNDLKKHYALADEVFTENFSNEFRKKVKEPFTRATQGKELDDKQMKKHIKKYNQSLTEMQEEQALASMRLNEFKDIVQRIEKHVMNEKEVTELIRKAQTEKFEKERQEQEKKKAEEEKEKMENKLDGRAMLNKVKDGFGKLNRQQLKMRDVNSNERVQEFNQSMSSIPDFDDSKEGRERELEMHNTAKRQYEDFYDRKYSGGGVRSHISRNGGGPHPPLRLRLQQKGGGDGKESRDEKIVSWAQPLLPERVRYPLPDRTRRFLRPVMGESLDDPFPPPSS